MQTGFGAAHQGMNDGDAFVARYTKRLAHLRFYAILWLIVVSIAYALLFDADVRAWLGLDRATDEDGVGGLVAVLAVVVAAMSFDFLWVVRALLSRRPALVIDRDGVRGFTGGSWREIAWSDVGYIRSAAGHFWIVRKPMSKIAELNHAYTRPGSRRRWEYGIGVPLARIDRSEIAIRAALREHLPDLG